MCVPQFFWHQPEFWCYVSGTTWWLNPFREQIFHPICDWAAFWINLNFNIPLKQHLRDEVSIKLLLWMKAKVPKCVDGRL